MTGEFAHSDVKDIKPQSAENFRNIKPEKEMSSKELNDAVNTEFNKAAKEAEGNGNAPKEYFDDNGEKYREGDTLLPNKQFEVKGYKYETDDKGRVVSAEGKLRMKDPEYARDMEDVRKIDSQEYKTSDDRGHLIGHQFGGSDKLENLVPMDAKLNQGDFVRLENTLADAVKDGADVKLKVEPVYEKDSTRPSEFKVSYTIDGDREVTVFKNESEAKS